MAYPKTLYRIVNSLQEEKAALSSGCTVEVDGTPFQEFPTMLYLYPADKTEEHKTLVINSIAERNAALAKGYQVKPHIPIALDNEFGSAKPVIAAPSIVNPIVTAPASVPAVPTTATPVVEKPV